MGVPPPRQSSPPTSLSSSLPSLPLIPRNITKNPCRLWTGCGLIMALTLSAQTDPGHPTLTTNELSAFFLTAL